MNAWLAGLFVTSAWICFAYSAIKRKGPFDGSKFGLVTYAMGTFIWSMKGVELGEVGLILISSIQTLAIVLGVILL